MKLSELNSITACEVLKSLLENDMTAINTKCYINIPEKSLPDFFIAIAPNGGMEDVGDMGQGIIQMSICVRLIKNLEINNIKLTKILDIIEEVIPFEGVRKDKYYFTLNTEYNFVDDMDYSLGYAVKNLNVYFRKERE